MLQYNILHKLHRSEKHVPVEELLSGATFAHMSPDLFGWRARLRGGQTREQSNQRNNLNRRHLQFYNSFHVQD